MCLPPHASYSPIDSPKCWPFTLFILLPAHTSTGWTLRWGEAWRGWGTPISPSHYGKGFSLLMTSVFPHPPIPAQSCPGTESAPSVDMGWESLT